MKQEANRPHFPPGKQLNQLAEQILKLWLNQNIIKKKKQSDGIILSI